MPEIHLPNINFSCTNCGNCCLSYGIPLFENEYENINFMARELKIPNFKLSLNQSKSSKNVSAKYILGLSKNEPCVFLDQARLCNIHKKYGEKLKPKICQLFPYSFTKTPNGYYVYLSFASSAVLYNYGQPLSQQNLADKLADFEEIYPKLNLNWQNSNIVDGVKLDFSHYLNIESEIMVMLNDTSNDLAKKLLACNEFILSLNFQDSLLNPDILSGIDEHYIDNLIIKYFHNLFFTNEDHYDLPFDDFLRDLVNIQKPVIDITDVKLSSALNEKIDTDRSEEILTRYIYCRIFGKLYFGSGFNNLSFVAGLYHLILIILIVKLEFKLVIRSINYNIPDANDLFSILVEIIRNTERKYTILAYSRQTCALLEVLLTCPKRIDRLIKKILID